MSNNNYHSLKDAPLFHVLLSTGLGTGFIPIAPGTAGAIAALGIWLFLYHNLSASALFITTMFLIILTTAVGVWTSNIMERCWGKDPRAVNIDEFVGTWIPLLVAPCGQYTWLMAIFGFAMFRIIDIFKPLGCRAIDEKCPGGWGIMFDDVLAGFYALLVTLCLKYIIM